MFSFSRSRFFQRRKTLQRYTEFFIPANLSSFLTFFRAGETVSAVPLGRSARRPRLHLSARTEPLFLKSECKGSNFPLFHQIFLQLFFGRNPRHSITALLVNPLHPQKFLRNRIYFSDHTHSAPPIKLSFNPTHLNSPFSFCRINIFIVILKKQNLITFHIVCSDVIGIDAISEKLYLQ